MSDIATQQPEVLDEEWALMLIEHIARKAGFKIVTLNMERSDLAEEMGVVNLHVTMETPERAFTFMQHMEAVINRTWGGEVRTGLYYAAIGYDDVPQGQALIQVDLLPFMVEPKSATKAAAPKP